MAFGTLSVLDTLKSSRQSIAEFGEDNAYQSIEIARKAHNDQFGMMVRDFIERTTDRQRAYGGGSANDMQEVDEFGRSDAQKIAAGVTVGFPLRKLDYAVQWTADFMETASVAELAAQFTAAQDAHIRALMRQIKKALFVPVNYTYKDRYVDNVDLAVKSLVNADSAEIPVDANGNSYDGATHTHYVGRVGGSVAASDITTLIRNVQEHYASGMPMLYISQTDESAIRAMTPNFVPILDARVMPASTSTVGRGALDVANLYNRLIGYFDGAEVWVKPWMIASYFFAYVKGAPVPLVLRERVAGRSNLRIVAENEYHPLRTQTLAAEFGVGVWNRTNGAILYSGGSSYVTPTIN